MEMDRDRKAQFIRCDLGPIFWADAVEIWAGKPRIRTKHDVLKMTITEKTTTSTNDNEAMTDLS